MRLETWEENDREVDSPPPLTKGERGGFRGRFLDFALAISSNAGHKWGMPAGGRRGLHRSSPAVPVSTEAAVSFAGTWVVCGSDFSRDGEGSENEVFLWKSIN